MTPALASASVSASPVRPAHRSLSRSLHRGIAATLTVLAAAMAAAPAQAQAPTPPAVAARAYILLDMASNQVLTAKDADAPVEPASLTKLMTTYLVFAALRDGKLSLQQPLPVSERAWRTGMTGASRTFIKVGSQVSTEDLVKGMIIQSGNDSTVALAEAVGGSVETFVDLMNRQAQAFGLKQTTFKNPEGLPAPGHTSTARELSILASRLIRDFPQYLGYYKMREFTYNGIKQPNRNLLLYRDPTVDGLKTGYTDNAGYCLIATARRDTPAGARRLLSVVIGAASMEARANESQKLLNWGYTAFDAVKLYDARQALTTARVWKGEAEQAKLGSTDALIVSVPRGTGSALKTDLQRNDPLVAPLGRNQRVGTIRVTANGQLLAERPLVALDAVGTAGWFGRAWDALRLAIQ